MAKIVFIPVGIVSGLVAGLLSKRAFDFAWSRVSEEDPPEPEHREVSWSRLAAALVLEGAIFRLTRGLAERGTRLAYHRLTGSWPGEERPAEAV